MLNLREEMDIHLNAEIEENLARGYSHDEARRAALLKFANPQQVREKLWRQNTLSGLDSLARNLKYGARSLGRSPGFAVASMVVISLGIGVNAALFTGRCHSPIQRSWCGCVNAPWAMASVSRATRMLRGSLPSGKSRAVVSLAWRSAVMQAITSPVRRDSSRRRSRQQHSRHRCSRYSASSRPWGATSPRPTTVRPRMERPC